MARVAITDLDDPRIAIYRSLKATNQTRGLGQFVVEGEKLVGAPAGQPIPPCIPTRHRPPYSQDGRPGSCRCADLCRS